MNKIYSVTVRDESGRAVISFCATLAKARLRSHIHRLQGYSVTRPAYMPRFSARIAELTARGQIVAPALRS